VGGVEGIGYNWFRFPHEYSGDGLGATVTWVRMRKKKPVISNTGKFFCFNNIVSNLYNNSVVEKIYGKAYIFTLLMFRKPNKTTINKNKTTNFYRQRLFDSRLYLDISRSFMWKESYIFRYFKVFQVSQIFTCGLSDLLLLAGSLVVFVLWEYILKVHIFVSSEHKLCKIWNTCFFKQIVDIFFLQSLLSRVIYTNYSV
jgi:hypothetical protein